MNPGTHVDQYEITGMLGAGGMGEVFRARDGRLNREVAIKVLPKDFASDADLLQRFEQEAKVLAALNHPHIMTVFGAGQHEGAPYLVSELLEGRTLREELAAGPVSNRRVTGYALQIALGLAAAHGKGVVHRDLKPDNIFVTRDGRVKILDFGLAKLRDVPGSGIRTAGPTDPDAATMVQPSAETTEPGRVMGTPSYMAPEQVRGEVVDHRADIFAFGCVLYEMVSGQRPFRRDTSIATMAAILDDDPADLVAAKPDLTPALARIVHRCLEKAPDNRFQSAKDLAFALSELAAGSSATRSPTGEAMAGRPPGKGLAWPATAAVLAVLLAVICVAWWRTTRTPGRASQIRSLAVLPFKVNTSDPKLAGLEKWIPLEIVSKLGQVANLQVVNLPTKIELLLSQNKDVDEIARELKVDGLVRSELAGQGEAMTVYVTVVDSTGRAVGKPQNLPASVSKISLIPNQVAEAVVNGLNVQLSATQRAEIQAAGTQNAEAFLAYQKGRDLMSRRLNAEASVEFRRAYQLDTNYTRAWTALAESEVLHLIYGGTTNEMATAFRRLSGEAERFHAQRLDDPALASLRMMIATLYERDWNKVRTIYWETQRNQKPDANLLNRISWYYAFVEGHPEQALHAREQITALDPENLLAQINEAYQLLAFGRYDDAVRAFRSLPPEKIQLEDYSRVLLVAGDLTGAKEVATRVLAGRPNAWTRCSLASIEAKSGAPDEARRILAGLEADAEKGMHIPFLRIAWSYGVLGDFEAARRWLRKGLLEGHGDWTMLELRTAGHLEMFGKLAWYWEIVDEMKFPPLQMDHPYFALEQAMRYGRGTVGAPATSIGTNEPPKALAVLPFVNMSADKDNEYFSDGITEEILNALARTPGLRVAARTSAFWFKGKNESVQRIGEALKVGVVLEGSVRRAGNQLRITAQLINVTDGFHLWSDTFDRRAEDVFAIQTEVAQKVAEILKVKLLAGGSPNTTLAGTDNLEAYDFYLRGRHFWNLRTGESLQRAAGLFQQATEKDPKFAAAYGGLGSSYAILSAYTGLPARETIPKAKAAARRALELDGRLAEAHAVLGWCARSDRDLPGAEQEFQEALRLNPNHATSHHWYSRYLSESLGKYDQALVESRMAQALDPLSPMIQANLGNCLSDAGRHDEALIELDKALKLSPDFAPAYQIRGRVLLRQKKLPEAVAELENFRSKLGDVPLALGWLGYGYARVGRSNEARQLIETLKTISASGRDASLSIVLVSLSLGDLDSAFVWSERGIEGREMDPRDWRHDPLWSDLVKDPRYAALIKKHALDR